MRRPRYSLTSARKNCVNAFYTPSNTYERSCGVGIYIGYDGLHHHAGISPVLRERHWLPIRERVKFKVACLVSQSLSGQAPLYLADDCRLVSDSDSTRRSLWSADVSTCVVPRTLSSYGDRSFAAAGPHPWNSHPVQLRNPDITYGLFRRQLKGHVFREKQHRAIKILY